MIEDGLSVDDSLPSSIRISGRITWPGDLDGRYPELIVKKDLDRDLDGRVSGRFYIYQACVNTPARTHEIFRFDNVHTHPGHMDSFHLHWQDEGNNEIHWIGQHNWPDLSDIIECLDSWWKEEGSIRAWDS